MLAVVLLSCDDVKKPDKAITKTGSAIRDLDSILISGYLEVYFLNSPTTYYLYKGRPMGFEYELLSRYAKSIGVIVTPKKLLHIGNVFEEIANQNGDIVAANVAVNSSRESIVDFTDPIFETKQVLVQRKYINEQDSFAEKLIVNPMQLAGKTIAVKKETSFYSRLRMLSSQIQAEIYIDTTREGNMESYIEMVADSTIDYTVVDANIASMYLNEYPNLDISLEISSTQYISWPVNKKAVLLKASINEWLSKFSRTSEFHILKKRYLENAYLVNKKRGHESFTLMSGQISPYDETIKQEVEILGWDWELLTAMIYQESQFDAKAVGLGGSIGLMQLMPETAGTYGMDSSMSAKENIHFGVKYLLELQKLWETKISDPNERIKFILASYNVGVGHVLDARKLARKYKKDPTLWDNNVADFLKLKSKPKYYKDEIVDHGYCRGSIPFNYVKEIVARYKHYKLITRDL